LALNVFIDYWDLTWEELFMFGNFCDFDSSSFGFGSESIIFELMPPTCGVLAKVATLAAFLRLILSEIAKVENFYVFCCLKTLF